MTRVAHSRGHGVPPHARPFAAPWPRRVLPDGRACTRLIRPQRGSVVSDSARRLRPPSIPSRAVARWAWLGMPHALLAPHDSEHQRVLRTAIGRGAVVPAQSPQPFTGQPHPPPCLWPNERPAIVSRSRRLDRVARHPLCIPHPLAHGHRHPGTAYADVHSGRWSPLPGGFHKDRAPGSAKRDQGQVHRAVSRRLAWPARPGGHRRRGGYPGRRLPGREGTACQRLSTFG